MKEYKVTGYLMGWSFFPISVKHNSVILTSENQEFGNWERLYKSKRGVWFLENVFENGHDTASIINASEAKEWIKKNVKDDIIIED